MKRIRLAFMLSSSPSAHSVGGWRHRRSYRGFDYADPAYWEHVARTLERGCFDMGFFADSLQLHDDYGGSPDAAIRYAIQFPRLDPMPILPLMARVTTGLGLGVTSSTSFTEPFYFARLMATLDHLTRGRMGWNIVASYGRAEARAFGQAEARAHQDRYARADEYAALCYRLWESWEPDAIVADRESGVYADPEKVHRFAHEGEHFRSSGPLSVPRSPQGKPLIIQAGASADGLAFAARHAELHFAARGSAEGMRQHMAKLAAALTAAGRDPTSVKVLWAASLFVGETDAEAKAREAAVVNGVPLEAGLSLLSGQLGTDLSTIPLDEPMRNLDPARIKGIQGLMSMFARDFGEDFTLREAARYHGAGMSNLRIVGSPERIADQLEALMEAGGDGFMFRPNTLPASIDDFVEMVVPVLQARGRARTRYPAATLRDSIAAE